MRDDYSKAEVEKRRVDKNAQATLLEGGSDYTLASGSSCWITVGNASVYLKHDADGVSVTLYPLHREDEDSITETWATWGEFDVDPEGDFL